MWNDNHAAVMEWLLRPHSIEEFACDYYERAPLYIERNDVGYYRAFCSLADVERMLFDAELDPSDLRIKKDGTDARQDEWTRLEEKMDRVTGRRRTLETVDPHKAGYLFSSGYTLFFENAARHCPPVADLHRRLQAFFGHDLIAGIFLTPADGQGLAVHYDSVDTFILQCEGRKRWRISAGAVELPLDDQPRNAKEQPGDLLMDVEMKPGDLLYLPRGTFHEPRASCGDFSLHVTFGLRPVKWLHLLQQALTEAAKTNVVLRASAHAEPDADAVAAALAQAFSIEKLRAIQTRLNEKFEQEYRNDAAGQLRQIVLLDALCENSIVGLRPGAVYRTRETEKGLLLNCSGLELTLPKQAKLVLQRLEESPAVRVSDLAGEPGAAVAILRRLVRAGLLEQRIVLGSNPQATAV